MFKIIQPGRFLGELLGRFVGPLMKVDVFFVKTFLGPLATVASASAIDGLIEEKSVEKKSRERKKGITWAISKKRLVDIIRTKKLLESSGAMIDEVSESVKPKIKRQESEKVEFLCC